MDVKRVQPSFGMAVKYKPSADIIRFNLSSRLGPFKFLEAENIFEKLEKRPIETTVTLNEKGRLNIEVGEEKINESFFKGPLKILRKALDAANRNIAQHK